MIKFSDTSVMEESLKLSMPESGIMEIKPKSTITEEEARDFIDRLFDDFDENEQDEDLDIESEVYGRSEDDFEFDVNDDEIQNLLLRFREDEWNKLDESEKEKLVFDFAHVLADYLGLPDSPLTGFYDPSPNDCGYYSPDDNIICVNITNFDDPQEIVDTVAHEMRHAYQYYRAQKMETYEDFLYAYNFNNYISPYMTEDGYVNFLDYQDQLVEAEARAFAKMFIISEED